MAPPEILAMILLRGDPLGAKRFGATCKALGKLVRGYVACQSYGDQLARSARQWLEDRVLQHQYHKDRTGKPDEEEAGRVVAALIETLCAEGAPSENGEAPPDRGGPFTKNELLRLLYPVALMPKVGRERWALAPYALEWCALAEDPPRRAVLALLSEDALEQLELLAREACWEAGRAYLSAERPHLSAERPHAIGGWEILKRAMCLRERALADAQLDDERAAIFVCATAATWRRAYVANAERARPEDRTWAEFRVNRNWGYLQEVTAGFPMGNLKWFELTGLAGSARSPRALLGSRACDSSCVLLPDREQVRVTLGALDTRASWMSAWRRFQVDAALKRWHVPDDEW